MAVDTAAFHKAHDELRAHGAELRSLAEQLPTLTARERERARRLVLRYLSKNVDPHTKLDKRLLYPAVAERLGDPLIEVSMNYDHLAIRHWISKIAAADVTDTDRLQRLLYGLDALIRVHIWKENELFLALLEESSWPGSGC
jgi:Hemerythrin HHE cation binding domain